MTYEENVRKVAEELRGVLTKTGIYDNIPSGGIDKAARIAVRLQAEAVNQALLQDYIGEDVPGGVIHDWLIERGLIPAAECQHHYVMCGYNEFKCEFCGQRK